MRVLIIDDQPGLRAGMRRQILGEWRQADVLEAPTLARGLALVDSRRPDLLVLDLSLPDAIGTGGAARMLRCLNRTPLLALSHEAERGEAARLLEMGAAGYLPKTLLGSEFLPALHRLLAGGRFVTASLAQRFLAFPVDANRR